MLSLNLLILLAKMLNIDMFPGLIRLYSSVSSLSAPSAKCSHQPARKGAQRAWDRGIKQDSNVEQQGDNKYCSTTAMLTISMGYINFNKIKLAHQVDLSLSRDKCSVWSPKRTGDLDCKHCGSDIHNILHTGIHHRLNGSYCLVPCILS